LSAAIIDTHRSRACSSVERWYVVIVMCLIYAINIADRYVVSTVLEPVRLELRLLDPACLSVQRSDNGQSLEAAMIERGFDPTAIRERRRLLDPSRIRAFLELHIEQGPTLVAERLPAAVVTGMRGCKRLRHTSRERMIVPWTPATLAQQARWSR
jgi:hypothetical protein